MQTEMPFFDGPEDALREAVRALGGPKKVGPLLWPDKSMDAAARLLQDCLNPGRSEKFDLSQILFLLKEAKDAGYHAAFQYLAVSAGYEAKPITRAEEVDKLTQVIADASKRLAQAMSAMERIQGFGQ